jgi:hypothetical protein
MLLPLTLFHSHCVLLVKRMGLQGSALRGKDGVHGPLTIERLHGVRFSQPHVWRILGSLGFSPQKPEKRAIERDEDAVRSWKRSTWPALKKKPSETAD